jgi:hypothetical protein
MSANSHSLEESVRPSTTLIGILHRRLLDPGIVPAFERRRANDLTGGLVRPRWVLIPASEGSGTAAADTASAAANDDASSGAKKAATSPNDTSINDALAFSNAIGNNALCNGFRNISMPSTKSNGENGIVNENIYTTFNAIPKWNYIDLRMVQNRMFADDQSVKCRRILSTLSSLAEPDPFNSDSKKWQKHADSLQSMVNEGLAACPNHAELLAVESDYKDWLQRRMDLLIAGTGISAAKTAKLTPAMVTKKDISVENSFSTSNPKKGAEGRAHAAMRDALAERSFLLQGGDATAVIGGGKRDGGNGEQGVKYPLILPSAADDEGIGDVDIVDGAGGESLGRRDREERRNRSKSKDHRKYHKYGDKIQRSKSRNDEKRRRVRGERSSSRRRSRSTDSGRSRSRSVSSSRSSSSSYSRRRHRRRKEKRSRRSKKERTRDERHRSRSYDSGQSRSRSMSTSSSRSSSSSYSRRRNDRHKEKRRRENKKKKNKRHRRHRGSRGGNEYRCEEVEEDNGNNTQFDGERQEVKEIRRGEQSGMLTADFAGKFD